MLLINKGLVALKGAKFPALAAAVSFSLAELTAGQVVASALFAALSAALAAWLASRPALIQARVVREQQQQSEHAEADKRLAQVHSGEVAWLQSRITLAGQQLVLMRQSKHNLSGYVESCHAYIHRVHAELRAAGKEPPPFEFKYYDELCGDEDRALALLMLPAEIHTTKSEG